MSYEDFSYKDLEIISRALYLTHSALTVPKYKRKENYEDGENILQRKINAEITRRKEKEHLQSW